MADIGIYHNTGQDNFSGFKDAAPLVWVFQFTKDYKVRGVIDPHIAILTDCFEIFNIGTGGIADAYRARRLRSLSVGDVVKIDGRAYSCERFGWKHREASELNFLAADQAEPVIRERYDIPAREELSVTVPLPD